MFAAKDHVARGLDEKNKSEDIRTNYKVAKSKNQIFQQEYIC